MKTLYGVAKYPGIAIATAIVVDVQNGLAGLPEQVMRRGLNALRSNMLASELPEVIVFSDLLSIGTSIRIPGTKTIGIVAQTDDATVLPVNVPCIVAVEDLQRSTVNGEIVIMDGNSGAIYIDPDVQTLIYFQEASEPEPTNIVVFEPEHIPTSTRDGRLIVVCALARSMEEVEKAISDGADSLIVPFDDLIDDEVKLGRVWTEDPVVELIETLVAVAAGKPITLAADSAAVLHSYTELLLNAGQVTAATPDEIPNSLSISDITSSVQAGRTSIVVNARDVADAIGIINGFSGDSSDIGL